MKKYFALAALISVMMLHSSCRMNVLKGSGDKTTTNPTVSPFSAVVIDVSLNAVLNMQTGAQPAVQLNGYENILKHIKTRVENNTLHIYSDLDETWQIDGQGITAQITLPFITSLTLNGADDADIHGTLPGSRFDVDISGAGNVNMDDVATDSFSVILSGAGNVHVKSGAVKYAEYEIDGSGRMKATALAANEAWATINGSGSIAVNAAQKLTASINGSGLIKYRGDPQLSQNINGSGSIVRE